MSRLKAAFLCLGNSTLRYMILNKEDNELIYNSRKINPVIIAKGTWYDEIKDSEELILDGNLEKIFNDFVERSKAISPQLRWP